MQEEKMVSVIGIGPGGKQWLTQEAEEAIRRSDLVVGYTVYVELVRAYFPEKEYRGLKYNEGYYESVVISIGKAEGDNWWCVLFPNLCFVDLETKDNVEYKSWIVEKINKIF